MMNLTDAEIEEYNQCYSKGWEIADSYMILAGRPNSNVGLIGKFRLKKAISMFEKANSINPNYSIHWGLGKIYQCLNDHSKATQHFKKSYDLEKTNVDVAREASMACLNSLDYEDALFFANKAIELEEDNAGLYCNKALIYIFTQQDDMALECVTKAYEMDTSDKVTENAKTLIQDIVSKKKPRPKCPTELL